jgi:hypothetical protein
MAERRIGLVQACDDPKLFGLKLWPGQRELLGAVQAGLARIFVWALGRRSGKSLMAALVCLHDCTLRPELDVMVRPGETRYAVAIATNLPQARLIVQAARSIVERSPLLAPLVEGVTEDELRFKLPSGARTALRAFPCSSRSGRGWPISTLAMDEAAFFYDNDGNAAAEPVWKALTPSTAQFGTHAQIILSSTPFGQSGLFAETWQRAHDGEIADAVAHHSTTAQMNPTITAEFLAAEQARDPDSFRSEYLAEFVGSGEAFLDFERIDLCGVPTASPKDARSWVAGLDPAFSKDPFGVALVGRTEDELVIGPVRALQAAGEFSGPLDEVAMLAREYSATCVTDQFSSAAVIDRLRNVHGLVVKVNTMTAQTKTAAFQQLRASLYDGSLRLPDHPPLVNELRRLRTKFTAGSAAILNPRVGGSHGDMAQALALAVHEATSVPPTPPAGALAQLWAPREESPWHSIHSETIGGIA